MTDVEAGLTSTNETPNNCPLSLTSGGCYYTQLANAGGPSFTCVVSRQRRATGICLSKLNNAIDNGLWLTHMAMNRYNSSGGAQIGDWYGNAAASVGGGRLNVQSAGDTGPNALYCTSFEVSGFLVSNNPPNPYSLDAARLHRRRVRSVDNQDYHVCLDLGGWSYFGFTVSHTFDPDGNSNGLGVEHNGGDANYQTGMMLDSIVAAGTVPYLNTTPIPAGTQLASVTSSGYLFKDAVQDMVDDYSYCQNPGEEPHCGVRRQRAQSGWSEQLSSRGWVALYVP